MNYDTYEALNQTNVTWICANCDTPNHSSLLDSHIDACINSFSPLSYIDSDSNKSTNSSIPGNTHIGSPGPPILRSSPIQPSTCKPNTRPRNILSVNLQSLPAKKEVFWEAVDACAPDIIIANETWLKPTIHTSEVMPPGFNTLRKDRADGYGGVLLAVSREFTDNQITTDTDKEIIATKISTGCKKTSLVIVSVYRPPNTDIDYALDLCSKIKHIVNTNRSATIWISDDLDLPDIDWKTESIEGHQNSNAINTAFLSAFQELGLAQIVDFPTRLHNTLDLFLTNRPSMISNCTPLPGVSDHETILTISDVQAKRLKPVSRKIVLWNKADIQNIRNDLSTFSSNYLTSVTINTPVEEQWRIISRHLTQTIDNLVPSAGQMTKHLHNLDKVLSRLATAGMTLNVDKCTFMAPEVTYLGYRIDKEGLHAVNEKVQSIAMAPAPQNCKELRSYLGCLNYYGRFIKNLSSEIAPLNKLLTKNEQFVWGSDEENAFQRSKELLQSSDVLVHYDQEKELIL